MSGPDDGSGRRAAAGKAERSYRQGMASRRGPFSGPTGVSAWADRLTELVVARAHAGGSAGAGSTSASALRIGDAERDVVAEAVRTAFAEGRLDLAECDARLDRVLAARTLADLAEVTADLPDRGMPPPAADTARPVAAVLGRVERRGAFVVAARTQVTVAGGQVVLDLSDALVQHRELVIDAKVLGGTLRVVVPDGVEVVLAPSIQAGRHSVSRRPPCGPGAPVLRFEGTITLGRLEIRRSPRRRPLRQRGVLGGAGRRALG